MNAHEEREGRRGGRQEGGGTTGRPQSPPCRRPRRAPCRNPACRFSQSPPAPCRVPRPEIGLRALLAVSLSVESVGGRDRAPTGPLRPPIGASGGGGGGQAPIGGPEQPGAGTAAEGRRRDVSSSWSSSRSHRRSWRACLPAHAPSAAAAPGSGAPGRLQWWWWRVADTWARSRASVLRVQGGSRGGERTSHRHGSLVVATKWRGAHGRRCAHVRRHAHRAGSPWAGAGPRPVLEGESRRRLTRHLAADAALAGVSRSRLEILKSAPCSRTVAGRGHSPASAFEHGAKEAVRAPAPRPAAADALAIDAARRWPHDRDGRGDNVERPSLGALPAVASCPPGEVPIHVRPRHVAPRHGGRRTGAVSTARPGCQPLFSRPRKRFSERLELLLELKASL